jgi:Secretion system C-terminal sorting domain
LLQNNIAKEIMVFPNPATEILRLDLNGQFQKVDAQILNLAGQVVKRFLGINASAQSISLPISELPAGSYWLHLQAADVKQVIQFVKQ